MQSLLTTTSFLALISVVCAVCAYSERTMLDLSYVYNNATQVVPGNPSKIWPFSLDTVHNGTWEAQGGIWWEMYNFRMSEHAGTHLDAPSHFAEGKWTIDQVPLANLVRRPVAVIDISAKAAQDPNAQITVCDLKLWERRHERRIPRRGIVLMYSGWGKYYGTPKYNNFIDGKRNFPSFSPEACNFLVKERNIVGVGVDSSSLDRPGSRFQSHVILMAANLFAIENGANFEKLPAYGALVTILPLRIEGGSGSPARMLAEFW